MRAWLLLHSPPPQSAILGMHAIVERPVAVKGKVEIRPMMNVALTYDHRLIDGREVRHVRGAARNGACNDQHIAQWNAGEVPLCARRTGTCQVFPS